MKANPFKIITFKYPSGEEAHRVTGMLKGKQIRKNFKTLAEATTAKGNYEREVQNLAPIPMVNTRLTADQASQAELAFTELEGFKLSLIEAVRWARANYSDPEKRATMQKAFDEFIEAKRLKNLRPATLRTLKQRIGKIKDRFHDKLVSDLQPEAIKAVIFRPGSGIVNQDSDYRAFRNFFNWSKTQGYCQTNPMDKIEGIILEREEPVILPLAHTRKLLAAALRHKSGKCIPYLALCLFAGIRDGEAEKLTWDDIDLKSKTVTIGAHIAKLRKKRIVELEKVAVELLRPHSLKKSPIKGVNWRKDFDQIKRAAGYGKGLLPWKLDMLRHTGISYHLVLHNENDTAKWAGNSPDIIQQRYRELVKKSDADGFWSLSPRVKQGTILKLKAA